MISNEPPQAVDASANVLRTHRAVGPDPPGELAGGNGLLWVEGQFRQDRELSRRKLENTAIDRCHALSEIETKRP
jgi:hypothetical protein